VVWVGAAFILAFVVPVMYEKNQLLFDKQIQMLKTKIVAVSCKTSIFGHEYITAEMTVWRATASTLCATRMHLQFYGQ